MIYVCDAKLNVKQNRKIKKSFHAESKINSENIESLILKCVPKGQLKFECEV